MSNSYWRTGGKANSASRKGTHDKRQPEKVTRSVKRYRVLRDDRRIERSERRARDDE